MPVAVEATAGLVDARWRAGDASGPPPEHAERALLAMCIVRLVNGLVDPGQAGARAVSVAGLAARRGLPRLLVDLRHEAAHNELPSLPALRLASTRKGDRARHYIVLLRGGAGASA